MNFKIIFLLVIFGLPFTIIAQSPEIEWVSAEAVIKTIETKRSGKSFKGIADIEYIANNGDTIATSVDLIRIPFLGSFSSVGDEISIYYDKNNPSIVQTYLGKFLYNYGMYTLIILGIIVSIRPLLKERKKRLNKQQ